MTKQKFFLKTALKTLLLTFLVGLINVQSIKAQGPGSPEAGGFEPVDATDMVNLVTGDFTYVLPLAEVPSPEGGYPIVLSYHAGIAMDQEASWVGLGWNINPGAINRGVNGYPDDWNGGKTSSILYDAGGEITSISISQSIGIGGIYSFGREISYSENRSYGGETDYRFSVDYNASIGIKGTPIGVTGSIGMSGIGLGVNFSFGKAIFNKEDEITGSYGANLNLGFFQSFQNGKSQFSSRLTGYLNKKSAIGLNFSSKSGLGFSLGNTVGINFSGTANNTNGIVYDNLEIGIPYTTGLFTIRLSYNKLKYHLFDNQYNNCFGSLYPGNNKIARSTALDPNKVLSDNSESLYKLDKELQQQQENNITSINKDIYRVSGQGIAGNISPGFYESSSQILKNIIGKTDFYGDSKVSTRNINTPSNDIFFNFDNSFSSFIRMKPGLWEKPLKNISKITDLNITGRNLLYSLDINGELKTGYNPQKGRKKDGNFVEVFTNSEITSSNIIEVNLSSGFNRQALKLKNGVKDGIGAYKITTLDGKTYHYSLPVYQKEQFTRNSELDKNDELRFQENLSFTPYATHWLLTAITGPDYVDVNTNGKLDDKDYGYWVEFDYGKWSDGFVWSSPSNEVISNSNKNNLTYYKDNKLKSYSWGVKEIYYLDKIRTRTHTAFFIKEERLDNTSTEVYFNNTNYKSRQLSNVHTINGIPYLQGFENPVFNYSNYNYYNLKYAEGYYNYSVNMTDQKSLLLKEIQIVSNKYLTNQLKKSNSGKASKNIGNVHIQQINKFFDASNNVKGTENLFDINNNYFGENYNYIYDEKDGFESIRGSSQKTIEFTYANSNHLVSNNPNSSRGKLTLKEVVFKQKEENSVIPPYRFTYNKNLQYNYEKRDLWGYYKGNPDAWSLNKITVPTGGEINIKYESDESVSVVKYPINFTRGNEEYELKIRYNPFSISVCSKNNDIIDLGDNFLINYSHTFFNTNNPEQQPFITVSKVKSAKVTEKNGLYYKLGNFSLPKNGSVNIRSATLNEKSLRGGGVRVSEIKVNNSTKTTYAYNGGVTSYTPSKIFKEIKYISELPSPSVMYNRVTVENTGSNGFSDTKTIYKFRTLNTENLIDTASRFVIPNLLDIRETQYINSDVNVNSVQSEVHIKKFEIKKNWASLGQLISIETLNNQDQILTKTENTYSKFSNSVQGVNQESIDTYKKTQNDSKYFVTTTSKINYPTVLEKTTSTQGNFTITKYFDKHDFLTGQAIETRTYGSDGKGFKSKIVPAYTIPEYSNMGSKIDNPNNKNMLTQTAASYSYLLNADGSESIINAGITTWNNKWNYWDHKGVLQSGNNKGPDIWRKHKSFFWKGAIAEDGTYLNYRGEDDNFNWGIGAIQANSSKWQKASETTRYDHYSMPLEQKDVNGNYAATKMGDNNSKVLAISNAAYTEMYYSGAEYRVDQDKSYFDGEIKSFGYALSKTAHTGNYIVSIGKNQNAFEVKVPARAERNTAKRQRFKVSVWVRTAQKDNAVIKVGGSKIFFRKNETITAGIWSLLNGYITIPPRQTTVAITSTNGTIELDDFRLHPITASMTSYVYNEFDEVTFITGANGLSTKYVYDEAGKLKETWVEVLDNPEAEIVGGFKRVHKNTYNYKN